MNATEMAVLSVLWQKNGLGTLGVHTSIFWPFSRCFGSWFCNLQRIEAQSKMSHF